MANDLENTSRRGGTAAQSHSRTMDNAMWAAGQKVHLAEVNSELEMLYRRVQELEDLANAIRQGLITLEGKRDHNTQQGTQ